MKGKTCKDGKCKISCVVYHIIHNITCLLLMWILFIHFLHIFDLLIYRMSQEYKRVQWCCLDRWKLCGPGLYWFFATWDKEAISGSNTILSKIKHQGPFD